MTDDYVSVSMPEVPYYFAVTAMNANRESAPTATLSATADAGITPNCAPIG